MASIDTEELRYLLNRRKFLAGSAALAAVPLLPFHALAQAAPHSFKQGDAEIIVLSDGKLEIPWNIVAPEASPEQIAEIAKRLGFPATNADAATNVVLVKSGSDLILFDDGGGPNLAPTAGKLAENMAAAGIDPAAITKVVFTHAHPDHIFGTLKGDGTLLLPNAAYYTGETEWNFWTDPGLAGKMPAQLGGMIKGAQANLAAVKDRVTMVKGGAEFLPGITAVDTPGHTRTSVVPDCGRGGIASHGRRHHAADHLVRASGVEVRLRRCPRAGRADAQDAARPARHRQDQAARLSLYLSRRRHGREERHGLSLCGGELTACHRSPGEARHRPRLLAFGLSSRQPYSRQEARAGFAS